MTKYTDNLTADVIRAEAAGMSYGKWKALHPYTKDDNPFLIELPEPKVRELVCKHCGRTFTPKQNRKNQIYCGIECRRLADQVRAQLKATPRKCVICGGLITKVGAKLYCGNTCKVRAYRQRQKPKPDKEE